MPITVTLSPLNVDASASNFIYAVAALTFSGAYSSGGDTLDLTQIADKLLSTQVVSAYIEAASSSDTTISESGGFYNVKGVFSLTPGQSSPVPTPLNGFKVKIFANTAGNVAELAAGAYPASVTSDNVQLVLTLRKMQ